MTPAVSFALTLIATAGATVAQPGSDHLAEIKVFASTVVIARTAHEECPGISYDDRYLEGLRQRMHVVEADYPAYVPEARAVANALHKGMAEAASRQAWCASVLRLYGPDGKMIRGLLRR